MRPSSCASPPARGMRGRYRHNEAPHYIALPGPMADAECDLIRKTRGLNVIKYSAKDDHKELAESLEQLVGIVNTKRTEIAGLQNW